MIKLADPYFDEAEVAAVGQVLTSGQLVQGGRVREFEALFAERVGSAHAVMVSSGTAALHLALLACGIGRGDAVIVPDYTFVATANVVALTGATPVFVDVRPDTYNIDPSCLRRLVEGWGLRDGGKTPRLRMILPVHQFGLPAEIGAIADIAREHGLLLVEDAACAIGSRYRGRDIGGWGVASCFSFHPRKVLTTGEGGAVVTNDGAIAEQIRALRAHGFSTAPGSHDLVACGFNYRMMEIQGALGIVQLGKLDAMLRRRRSLAELLHRELRGIRWFTPPVVPTDVEPNWQSYVGVVGNGVDPSVVMDKLAAREIETRSPATALHQFTPYRTLGPLGGGSYPVAEMLAIRALALPLHPRMDEADIVRVALELRNAGPT